MYQLYQCINQQEIPVSFNELQNKAFWCRLGEQKERAFVEVMYKINSGYQVQIHPEKKHNPYHPDLLCIDSNSHACIAEVKVKNSPLFMADQYGINPQSALTMDLKDSFNYHRLLEQGTDLLIFIWVKWEAHKMKTAHKTYQVRPMRGIWLTRFSKLRAYEQQHSPPIHWYKEHFRQPTQHLVDSIWGQQLLAFEPRLQHADHIRNLTSNGYLEKNQMHYPAGQSSASYVFDLHDANLFTQIFLHWD